MRGEKVRNRARRTRPRVFRLSSVNFLLSLLQTAQRIKLRSLLFRAIIFRPREFADHCRPRQLLLCDMLLFS